MPAHRSGHWGRRLRTTIQTPGVFIIEKNAFPVQEFDVPTAVPAFIGYSEMAKANGADTPLTPVRLRSMAEYEQAFGGAHRELFYLTAEAPAPGDVPAGRVSLGGTATYTLVKQGAARFTLYDSMRLFFANGGGECVVISCGAIRIRFPPRRSRPAWTPPPKTRA
jgi:phage tail sheath protein FI